MAEFYLPYYCNNDIVQVDDTDLIILIKEFINRVMIENRIYYDNDDLEAAVEIIYPVIEKIVFSPNFLHVRGDKQLLSEVTTYLVKHLS